MTGIEPARLLTIEPKSIASASSATSAKYGQKFSSLAYHIKFLLKSQRIAIKLEKDFKK